MKNLIKCIVPVFALANPVKTNRLSTQFALAIAAFVGFALLMPAPAYAGISVSKEITEINADGIAGFEIPNGGTVAAFLDNVPNTTVIVFRMVITVQSTGGQNLSNVVVTDRFGAELGVSCVSATSAGGCGDVALTTKGGSDKVFLTWSVGALGVGSATLTLDATTDTDPGGFQEYTECGLHEFNSGPTAKGRVAKDNLKGTRQVSDDGAQITLTVSGLTAVAFPQCSNCIDDDGDLFIDLLDPECTDALDNDETNL